MQSPLKVNLVEEEGPSFDHLHRTEIQRLRFQSLAGSPWNPHRLRRIKPLGPHLQPHVLLRREPPLLRAARIGQDHHRLVEARLRVLVEERRGHGFKRVREQDHIRFGQFARDSP